MDDSLFVFDISKRQPSTYFNYNYAGSQYMSKLQKKFPIEQLLLNLSQSCSHPPDTMLTSLAILLK